LSSDIRTGEIFTRYYAVAGAPLSSDSLRFRNRLSGLVSQFWNDMQSPAAFVKLEVGIEFPNGYYQTGWDNFIKDGPLGDVLDVVTALFRLANTNSHFSPFRPSAWRASVQRIFDEERLSYQMDAMGGIRFRVDEAFEAERSSAIGVLSAPRYAATRAALDDGFAGFDQSPHDTRAAIRGIFDAAETLFKLMFPNVARLGASEVDRELARLLETQYSGASLKFARMQNKSFREWVNAAHTYRHAQGVEDPDPPALDLALAAVGAGTAFVRWLAMIDQRNQARAASPQPER
jgi:hypothetical protein